jgi:hypothetical protein
MMISFLDLEWLISKLYVVKIKHDRGQSNGGFLVSAYGRLTGRELFGAALHGGRCDGLKVP